MENVASSSQLRVQLTTEQEIKELEGVLAKILQRDGSETTIDVTSKSLHILLGGIFKDQDAVFKDPNLRNNFCRFDIQQYAFSQTDQNSPKVHYRYMMSSACSCHSVYRGIHAAGDRRKMESFINFSDFSRCPDTHTIKEMTPWYTRLKDVISNHSDDAATAVGSMCSSVGGAAAISVGVDPKTTTTGMAMLKFLAEKGFKQAVLTLGQCPKCGDVLSKYKERALQDLHYFKHLEIADEEILKGIDHLRKIVSIELDAKKHISELEKKLKEIESRYEGYKTHSQKLTTERDSLEEELNLTKEQLTQEGKTEQRFKLEEQITLIGREKTEVERSKIALEEEIRDQKDQIGRHQQSIIEISKPLTDVETLPPEFFNGVLSIREGFVSASMLSNEAVTQIKLLTGAVRKLRDQSILKVAVLSQSQGKDISELERLKETLSTINVRLQESTRKLTDQEGSDFALTLAKTQQLFDQTKMEQAWGQICSALNEVIYDRTIAEQKEINRAYQVEISEKEEALSRQSDINRAYQIELSEKEEALSRQSEINRTHQVEGAERDRRMQQQDDFFAEQGALIEQKSALISRATNEIERLRSNETKRTHIKNRIDKMGLPRTQNAPEFRRAAEARLLKLKTIDAKLGDFSGWLVDSTFYRRTSFVKDEATQSVEKLKEITDAFMRLQGIENRTLIAAWHQISDRLSATDNYLDIVAPLGQNGSRRAHSRVILDELKVLAQDVHSELHQTLKNTGNGLQLYAPRDARGSINWQGTELERNSPSTFSEKLLEIASRILARKWIEENNKLLEAYISPSPLLDSGIPVESGVGRSVNPVSLEQRPTIEESRSHSTIRSSSSGVLSKKAKLLQNIRKDGAVTHYGEEKIKCLFESIKVDSEAAIETLFKSLPSKKPGETLNEDQIQTLLYLSWYGAFSPFDYNKIQGKIREETLLKAENQQPKIICFSQKDGVYRWGKGKIVLAQIHAFVHVLAREFPEVIANRVITSLNKHDRFLEIIPWDDNKGAWTPQYKFKMTELVEVCLKHELCEHIILALKDGA